MRRARVLAMAAWLAAAGCTAARARADGRDVLDLDGTWQFATDPADVGEKDKWFAPGASWPHMPRQGYAPGADGRIVVPGIWDAQGYGTETDKLRHNFVGKGWYRKQVRIPPTWRGRRVFLRIGGVHRAAKVWIEGHVLGQHVGYLSAFEFDVTGHVQPGQVATVIVQVDSKRRWDVDALIGCADLIDYVHVDWGGIWGHVSLEARGERWLEGLFLQPRLGPARCEASATVRGDAAGADAVRLEVFDQTGGLHGRADAPITRAAGTSGRVRLAAAVRDGRPWTPDSPVLYTARLSLLKAGRVVDAVSDRFGMRTTEVRGASLLLNGRKLFLRGYGDDHIFPKHMALPTDKELYLRRLRRIKSYGFNHVRHHSTILPDEYYDACDEAGMLVSAEFPIAYQNYYRQAGPEALETYRREWAAAIQRHRNHPSILDWCMGNELRNGVPLTSEFARIVRRLDPQRLFVDTDGTFLGANRDTLDLLFVQFDVGRIPLDKPGKFRFDAPAKPVVSHETGNYVTFPRLDAIEQFRHNIKPFWLVPCRQRLRQLGLLGENERWARNSERLYLLCHKLNLEALRKNPHISGYHWWLFQDYWTTSNGLVDWHFRPKSIDPGEVLPINGDVVLLEDGLDVTCRGGAPVRTKLLVSNYSPEALRGGRLTWRWTASGRTLSKKVQAAADVAPGEVAELASIEFAPPGEAKPVRLTLEAELAVGERHVRNAWSTWLYPPPLAGPKPARPVFAARGLLEMLRPHGARPVPPGALDANAVYVAEGLDDELLAAVGRGARLILLQADLLDATATKFKTAWWKGSHRDSSCGTVVYDHPVIRHLARDGWCDAGWYHLLQGARAYLLDGLRPRPGVVIRSIPVAHLVCDRALILEGRLGSGSVLLSGLNHRAAAGRPENDWLLGRMIAHAAAGPRPKATLSEIALRAHMPPPGPYLSGFQKIARNEGEVAKWHSFREDNVRQFTCRQTKVGQLVEWFTSPVPANWKADHATFVFAGGLGWQSEPRTKGLSFLVNGRDVLRFDLAERYPLPWTAGGGKVSLRFVVRRRIPQDDLGLFFVTVPGELLVPGKPLRLGVRSLGTGSQRWFGLHPYTDAHRAVTTR